MHRIKHSYALCVYNSCAQRPLFIKSDLQLSLDLTIICLKIFLSTKGTINDVRPELKAFLDYVDNGTIAGDFVSKIDTAVKIVKSNDDWRLEFMTYQMALLESKLQGEESGRREGERIGRNAEREAIALKMIKRGKPFSEIHEDTDLPIQRIQQLAYSIT